MHVCRQSFSVFLNPGLIKEAEKNKQHATAKKIEHFLIGFDPESKEWIILLSETFYDIFLHYNYQFVTILEYTTDAWSKAMRKITSDIVNRIFEHLPTVEEEKSLTKDVLIKCFMYGKSNAKISKKITKG